MPQHDCPARDRWPVLPTTSSKLAFDTPARAFFAADGWEEARFGRPLRHARAPDGRLLVFGRAAFVAVAIVALVLSARFAAKLFLGSVGGLAPVAVNVEPRLD